MLTTKDLADEVQMTQDTIRYAIASGELVGFKFGNEYRIRRADADAWIEDHRFAGTNPKKPVTLARGKTDPYVLGKVAS